WSSSLCRGHKQPTTGASEATRCLCLVRHSGGEPVDFLPVFPQSDPRAPEGPALHLCPLIPPCEPLTTARLCATAWLIPTVSGRCADSRFHALAELSTAPSRAALASALRRAE